MEDFEKIISLESQIQEEINKETKRHVSFRYVEPSTVKVFTHNMSIRETFLLGTFNGGDTIIDALGVALDYIKNHKNSGSVYTVEFIRRGEVLPDGKKSHKSYFYGNPMDALSKFYEGKDPDNYVVYSITLNPVA